MQGAWERLSWFQRTAAWVMACSQRAGRHSLFLSGVGVLAFALSQPNDSRTLGENLFHVAAGVAVACLFVKVFFEVLAPRSSLRTWMSVVGTGLMMIVLFCEAYGRMADHIRIEELLLRFRIPIPDLRVPLAVMCALIWAGWRARSRPLRLVVAAVQATVGIVLIRVLEVPWSLAERLWASEPATSVELFMHVAPAFGGLALLGKSFDDAWKEIQTTRAEVKMDAQRWASDKMPQNLGLPWLLDLLRRNYGHEPAAPERYAAPESDAPSQPRDS